MSYGDYVEQLTYLLFLKMAVDLRFKSTRIALTGAGCFCARPRRARG